MRLSSDRERISGPRSTCRYQRRRPTSTNATSTTPTATATRVWSSGGTSRGTTCTARVAISREAELPPLPRDAREDRRCHDGRGDGADQSVAQDMLPDGPGDRHGGDDRRRRDVPQEGAGEHDDHE